MFNPFSLRYSLYRKTSDVSGITNRFFCQQPCLIVLIVRISKLPAEFVVLNFPFQKIILIRKDCHLAFANNRIFSNLPLFSGLVHHNTYNEA